jgi:hypothetical protein
MSNDDIRLDKTGRPFTTEEKATSAMRAQDMPADMWGVYPRDGGFVIVKHAVQMAFQNEARDSSQVAVRNRSFQNEKYHWVMFPERGNPQEPEFVELSWEGNRITIARGQRVPMAGRFLGVCDNAVQQIFEPAPRGAGAAYVKVGKIKRRPYTIMGDATRADFDKYMAEGNGITRRSFVRQEPAADNPSASAGASE